MAKKKKRKEQNSAAAMFKRLIMAGKLTDDQIFAKVQGSFDTVADDKRWYVAWYRNKLKKTGAKPPMKKLSKKKAKRA